jgi:hypothetical protein
MSELGSTIGSGDFARINVSHKGPGPFLSRPTRWNVFLPMSMPIVAMASRQLVLRGGPASQFKSDQGSRAGPSRPWRRDE